MTTSARSPAFDDVARYDRLMDVVRGRMTNRAFAPHAVPREHFAMILEAAGRSGSTRS